MASSLSIDLNCDLGESYGRYKLGEDATMMPLITSANIACGFHAGDPQVMAQTVELARVHGVAVGAHPGYPDLQGFGRRKMSLSPEEVYADILYQCGALAGFTRAAGVPLVHVKPHGALYNQAALDSAVADAIARALVAFHPDVILVGLAGSALTTAGEAAGLRVVHEGFPDRAYMPNGQLLPRSQPGALITDPRQVAENAVRLVRDGIRAGDRRIQVETLCLHGDNPEAISNARAVRAALITAGVQIRPLAR